MPALRKFQLGDVVYPLTDSTAKSLIEDADPALHYALQLYTFALKRYVGPRLIAEAKKVDDIKIPSAVEASIAYEPSPFVLSNDIEFPIFCLYRVETEWQLITKGHVKSVSTWEWAYVLPPLTPAGIKALQPILWSVAATMAMFTFYSFDPSFEQGKTLRDLSGLMSIKPGPTRFGDFEKLEGEAKKWWRAVTGQLIVEERDELVISEAELFEGADITLDIAGKGVETVPDFLTVRTWPAPVIETIGPTSGSASGGTAFEIYGRNFRPGTLMRVIIGGAFADNVVVVHDTKLVGLAPPGGVSFDGVGADVQVVGADGQLSNVLAGGFRFLNP